MLDAIMSKKGLIGGVIASFVGVFVAVKSIFLVKVRLRMQHGENLYKLLKKEGIKLETISEWYRNETPRIYIAHCWFRRMYIHFLGEERILRAGQKGTDFIVILTVFRWNVKKIIKILEECDANIKDDIPIYLLMTWESFELSRIPLTAPKPYLEDNVLKGICDEVAAVKEGKKDKVGLIFHGTPGNGKTHLVKYLAGKFKLPVYLVNFYPDLRNEGILRMFSHAKGPCIVLIEEFDKVFDGEKCLLPDAQFTLDSILNVLDGIYTPSKGVINILTAKNIDNVDSALKERPSRFKIVEHITAPSEEMRLDLLSGLLNERDIAALAGKSLDELLMLRDQLSKDTLKRA